MNCVDPCGDVCLDDDGHLSNRHICSWEAFITCTRYYSKNVQVIDMFSILPRSTPPHSSSFFKKVFGVARKHLITPDRLLLQQTSTAVQTEKQAEWKYLMFHVWLKDCFLHRGWLERLWCVILLKHRLLQVFYSNDCSPWYGLYSGTIVIVYAFLIEMIASLQYPYDDGSCGAQNSDGVVHL